MLCKTNMDLCSHSLCKLTFKTRLIKQLTWTCNLIKQVDVLNIRVTLYYRYRSGYKQFLIDVNVDHCAYHGSHIGSAVLELIHENFKNYTTNVWHPCPFLPGNLSVNNLPLTPSLVKNLFLPAGDYKLVLNASGVEELPLVWLALFINIPAGRTLEDDRMG